MRTTCRARLGLLAQHLDRDPRLRPFAGIVDQIADHLLEVLPLAAKARLGSAPRASIAMPRSRWIFSIVRASAVTTGATSVTVPTTVDARREPRALEMARDLVAHDVGLLAHLLRPADRRRAPPPR